MDWKKCALCQEDDNDLVDPQLNNNLDNDGYGKLALNIESFVDKDIPLPTRCTVSISDLRGESNIASNLRHVQVKWHKSCALQMSSSKLKRAMCRKEKEHEVPSKHTRRSLDTASLLGNATYFFCDESGVFYDETQPMTRMDKELKSKLLPVLKHLQEMQI